MLENEIKGLFNKKSTVQAFLEHCYVPGVAVAAGATISTTVATLC